MKLYYYVTEHNGKEYERGPYFTIGGVKQLLQRWIKHSNVICVREYELVKTQEYSRDEFLAITTPYNIYRVTKEDTTEVFVLAKNEYSARNKLNWEPVKEITCIVKNVIK